MPPMPRKIPRIVLGSLALELILRGGDLAIRVRDAKSPLRVEFPGLRVYPIDPSGASSPDSSHSPVRKRSFSRTATANRSPICRRAPRSSRRTANHAVSSQSSTAIARRLFVLFADATNRDETYAAGRFLYAPLPRDGQCSSTSTKPSTPPARSPPTPPARSPPPKTASLARRSRRKKSQPSIDDSASDSKIFAAAGSCYIVIPRPMPSIPSHNGGERVLEIGEDVARLFDADRERIRPSSMPIAARSSVLSSK